MENRRVIYQRQSLTSPSAVFGWASPYGSARGRDSYYVSRLWRHWPSFLVLVSDSHTRTHPFFSPTAHSIEELFCFARSMGSRWASHRRWNNAGESVAKLRNDGDFCKKTLIVWMQDKRVKSTLVIWTARWILVKTYIGKRRFRGKLSL